MPYSVSKEFTFCAAHRIIGHSGKCNKLHGHGYRATVQFGTRDLNPLGMVVDFQNIKDQIGTWINAHWDHNTLLNGDDQDLIAAVSKLQQPYLFAPGTEPTAEVMARELHKICERFVQSIPREVWVVSVRIDETDSCSASYSKGD